MTFLPIVSRELRVTSRRSGTYWMRSINAVLAVIIGAFVFFNSGNTQSHEIGQGMFISISVLAFIYCLGSGLRSTADCLSEEKREGTLGLLFLTDLKGYDVVAGKLVATSLNSFFALLAILPVLAIPLLMGGLTNGEFWRTALLLANTFTFSLAVGMFVSSISVSPRKAIAITLTVILVMSLGLPMARGWFWARYFDRSPHAAWVIENLTPEAPFEHTSQKAYMLQPSGYWWPIGILHGLSWICLLSACFIVPRSWQDNPPGAQKQRWSRRWRLWSYGNAGERMAFRKRLLDVNAILWLSARSRLKPFYVWIVLFVAGCLWTLGEVKYHSEWINEGNFFITAILLNSILKIWITSEAGHRLGNDRKIGALELILSTPLSVAEIVRGQVLALIRQFLAPLAVVLFAEIILLAACLHPSHSNPGDVRTIVSLAVAYMFMLVADVLALPILAMWVALTTPNPNRTTGIVIRRILLMPWIVTIVIFMLTMMTGAQRMGPDSGITFFLTLYCVSGIAADLFYGATSWVRLHAQFREKATLRFTTSKSFFKRLFSRRTPV